MQICEKQRIRNQASEIVAPLVETLGPFKPIHCIIKGIICADQNLRQWDRALFTGVTCLLYLTNFTTINMVTLLTWTEKSEGTAAHGSLLGKFLSEL